MPDKLRVMVDANVLIAGVVWPRWPFEVLRHARHGDFRLVLSRRVIGEARRIIQNRFPNYSEPFEAFLQACDYELADEPSKDQIAANLTLVRDPADVPIALTAINAGVDVYVTSDRDFTDRDESTEKLHQRLTILLPGTFLREHMGWTSEELEAARNRSWRDLTD